MDGPTRWSWSQPVPLVFGVFAPRGDHYYREVINNPGPLEPQLWREVVILEFATSPDFVQNNHQVRYVVNVEGENNAPKGYGTYTPDEGLWEELALAAEQTTGRVYYRVQQCNADMSTCVVSSDQTGTGGAGELPFVHIGGCL